MSAVLKPVSKRPETASDLIDWCREHREGTPGGDITDPAILRAVLTALLERHLADLAERAEPPVTRWDLDNGRNVIVDPGRPAPDPRHNPTARGLATLLSYLDEE